MDDRFESVTRSLRTVLRNGHAGRDIVSDVHGRRPRRPAPAILFVLGLFVGAALLTGCQRVDESAKPAVPVYRYRVVNAYPHDTRAYTQGLVYSEPGRLLESTGLYGRSALREVDLVSGRELRRRNLPRNLFGEGLCLVGDRVVMLTWKARRGFVFNKDPFNLLEQFELPREGWGITYDGQQLIASDGSANLYFMDPVSFETVRTQAVQVTGGSITNLNELEYINGEVWANVWMKDRIARIDPQSGRVTGWIDLEGLLPADQRTPKTDVLNGIAWDAETKRLFVTGKNWPWLFEVELVPGE